MNQIHLEYTTIQHPLPKEIWESLNKFSETSNLYHPQPLELIEKLSSKYTIPNEYFFLTAGCDEAIQLFAQLYGAHSYVFTPAYIVYSDVKLYGGTLTHIPSLTNNIFEITTDLIPDATLIYLANPNNPAGITSKEKVIELIKNNPQAIVVIDEAYAEFCDLSVIQYVKEYKNLAVLRSFSKSYGMAGNRIGYIVTQPEIVQKLKRRAQWCNVSYLSVGAAISALSLEHHFKQIRKDIALQRTFFENFLSKKHFSFIPSHINAVLLRFPSIKDAQLFVQFLLEHGITVNQGNGFSNIGLDDSFVRIAIGNEQQMNTVKQVIDRYS